MKKILIIKLGALGDIIRTFPVAEAIKEKYPDSELTWITKDNALDLFKNNLFIDRVFTIANYPEESFDLLYNFDIDDEATKIASKINAKEKYGFYSESGYAAPFNPGAEYYLNILFDDELKKTNKKTYQEMMFETAGLECKNGICRIHLAKEEEEFAKKFLIENNLNNEKLIGVNIGASSRWPSKVWAKENLKEFIIKANEKAYSILLFGGPNEAKEHKELFEELSKRGIKIYKNNPNNSLREFFSLVSLCNKMVCSDTLALHASLALGKQTIGLFFCTPPDEIEGYGLLKKISSSFLHDFFPEKMDQYDEGLVKSISHEEVLKILESFEKSTKVVNAIIKHPSQEKFLVIKRKEGIHKGKWAFPGGIVEEGETEEEAMMREIYEETGLEVSEIVKKISEYSYKREDGSETLGKSFLVKAKNSEVVINEEVEEFKWVSPEEFLLLDHIEGIDEELLSSLE